MCAPSHLSGIQPGTWASDRKILCKTGKLPLVPPDLIVVSNKIIVSNKLLGLFGLGLGSGFILYV